MNEKRAYALLVIFIAAGLSIGVLVLRKNPGCQLLYRDDVNIKTPAQILRTQKATTNQQRQQGLSGRSCIGTNQAMLFIFDKPGFYPFWMKGMKFPIDIVWLNSAKQVIDVQDNIAPATYPQTFSNQAPAQYVIEVKAGFSAKDGLVTGAAISY